eukprot:s2123_g3.t1
MEELPCSNDLVAVQKGANPGSMKKALQLLKRRAVKITGRSLDGGVAAEVQSEQGGKAYTVRLGRTAAAGAGEVDARCGCVDFRTRGGLCKHGAAAALFLFQAGHELPQLAAQASAPVKRPRSERPPATPTRNKLFEPGSVSPPEEVDEALPALKRPQFPQPRAAASAAVSQMQRVFFLRQLQTAATAGNHAAFFRDLQRIHEPIGETEVAELLHKAICGSDAAGAEKDGALLYGIVDVSCQDLLEVVEGLLAARPEAAAAARAGIADALGRTPLHAAVAANRLEVCRALLSANADPGLPDGHGISALELASRRKLDTSKGNWRHEADPFHELLRGAVMAETMARADLPRLPTALPTLLAASARTRSEPTQLEAKDVKAEAGPPEGPLGEQPSETLGLTKERAITLQLELMAAYGTPAFQKQLHEIGRRHGTLGVQSSLRGLVRRIQLDIIPRYGFDGSEEGVHSMLRSFKALEKDPDIEVNDVAIKELLSLEVPPMELNEKNKLIARPVTKHRIMDLLRVQLIEFSKATFQADVEELKKCADYNSGRVFNPSRPMEQGFEDPDGYYHLEGRAELALLVQTRLLPQYGFAPSKAGVQDMIRPGLSTISVGHCAPFVRDPDVANLLDRVNEKLGMSPAACHRFRELVAEFGYKQKMERVC